MDLLWFLFCLVFAMSLCASVYNALWSPAGKGLTSWLSFVVSTVSFHFPIGILGQVWYLIVSIPDLCTLTYFYNLWARSTVRFLNEYSFSPSPTIQDNCCLNLYLLIHSH